MTYRHTQSVEQSLDSSFINNLSEANTAIPAFIESYDQEMRTVEVSIPISDFKRGDDGSENEEDWPKLPDVPVLFPGGGDFNMSWPLKNGDPVLLVFCQRDLIRWLVSDGKEPHSPELSEVMGANGAICIPRLYPEKSSKSEASNVDVTMQFKDTKFIIKSNGDVVIDGPKLKIGSDSAGTALANGEVVDSHITAIASKVDAMGAILGLPPLVLIGNRKSTKAFTND